MRLAPFSTRRPKSGKMEAVRSPALDITIVLLYLVGVTAQGMWLGRRSRTARDYFLSDRTIPCWAILLSIVASETSALTFISVPGLAYLTDHTFLQITLGYVLGRTVAALTLIPRYFDGELVSAYALLERRFGRVARRFASILFAITRVVGESVRVFATAIPVALILTGMFGLGAGEVRTAAILVIGVFTVPYTYAGGMRADVWTDVVQLTIYLLGALAAAVLIGLRVDGGWSAILSAAHASGGLRVFDFSLGFDRPYTLLSGLIGGAFLAMASHGVDQMMVQRLLASRSRRQAQVALIGSGVLVLFQFLLFLTIGTGLRAYYHGASFSSGDVIFPRFIVEAMPSGLSGLLVAATLAATMGTLSSSLNSLAAVTTYDVYLPLSGRSPEDPGLMKVGKRLTLAWAVVMIGGALLFRDERTPAVALALSIASFTYGALLGAFGLALFDRRARQRDAVIGMAIGLVAMAAIVPLAHVAWTWFVPLGTGLTFLAGGVSARL